ADSYAEDVTDEFVIPAVLDGYDGMKKEDGVIFFNFRPDRARELTHAFTDETFDGFKRDEALRPAFVTMTQYEAGLNVKIAYPPEALTKTLGEVIEAAGMTQLRIAETEKYAHVTFFFNGGLEKPYENEDRILVPSPKVATYDLQPEMSAIEVTDKVVEAIGSGKYDFIILNFANGDMVGHTGVMDAAVKAVETVDACVGRVVEAIRKAGGVLCITADHGNCEQMLDKETGAPFTQHTTNPVPFILVNARHPHTLRKGKLCDIAPTLLQLAGLDVPKEMSGVSLIEK
ncbi:MAG: phosphoglycerate mutase (2,3-diphosphoglycerate-independent), partial [Schwartzia sp.]|nr:phosphoglycerate mutase (2,3-diphosphoglycerate-independent) [Schwartzia sp. (in: firmicutes)]